MLMQFFKWLRNNFELLAWGAALLALFIMDAGKSQPSLCISSLIGIGKCPGCGIGHSIHYALHLDFAASVHHHIMGIPAVIIIFIRIKQLLYPPKKYMRPNLVSLIPSIEGDELIYLQALTKELNPEQLHSFIAIYNGKRRKADQVLLGCVLGFVCIAGVQRFMVGQIAMGLLYFFTGGLCLIGTIVDTVNHKRLAFEYNQKMAIESIALAHAYGQ